MADRSAISQKLALLRRQEEEARTQEHAQRLNLPYAEGAALTIDGIVLAQYEKDEITTAQVFPYAREDHTIAAAAANPLFEATRAFTAKLKTKGLGAKFTIVSPSSLKELLSEYERYARAGKRVSGEVTVSHEKIIQLRRELKDIEELRGKLTVFSEKDFSEAVELVMAGALFTNASDIHIEPKEGVALVRLRIDGILHDIGEFEQQMYYLVLERIKLLAGLKLNIKNRAQDGRFTIKEDGQDVEIRASTLPGKHGEFIALRLLNPQNLLSLDKLGLREDLLSQLSQALRKPNGMVLTTGPTGSGKTTLLYALVQKMSTHKVKIVTIEDPIEYRIAEIEQTQVAPEEGYTFAKGLRAIVRQDPDYILVGEVRDKETADIALQAALTGHLVFSTLHTNDAPGAIPRLIELGAKPETIAPALSVVVGQRLLRRLCTSCTQKKVLTAQEKERIKKTLYGVTPLPEIPSSLMRARGCTQCHNIGYRGRLGIFELFFMGPEMESLTLQKPSTFSVRKLAIQKGMRTLQQDGLLRVLEGMSDLEELERITGPLEDIDAFLKVK